MANIELLTQERQDERVRTINGHSQRLANKELRLLKNKAHRLFDALWKSRQYYRDTCYKQLAWKMNIDPKICHFGWFDKDLVLQAINILEKGLFD